MRNINPYRCLLKGTLVGCSAVIMLSFAWYSFLGEGKGGTGDYFTSYKLDKLCKRPRTPVLGIATEQKSIGTTHLPLLIGE